MRLYEGMFLIEGGRVSQGWDETEKDVVSILEKHGASIRQANRYDERKLAYPVRGARRGAYLLAYFEASPESIDEMRQDLNLSEAVLRNLILVVDNGVVPESVPLGNAEPTETLGDLSDDDGDDDDDEDRDVGDEDEGEDDEDEGEDDEDGNDDEEDD